MENQEKKYVNGLFVKRREQAPNWVVASLSFNEKFIDYLKDNFNASGYCNVDVLISKEGTLYAKKNDFESIKKAESDEIRVENVPF